MIGVIKAVVAQRGCGFAIGQDGADYFFHMSDCPSVALFYSLSEGDEVVFEPVEPEPVKGKRARGVQRIEAPEPATTDKEMHP